MFFQSKNRLSSEKFFISAIMSVHEVIVVSRGGVGKHAVPPVAKRLERASVSFKGAMPSSKSVEEKLANAEAVRMQKHAEIKNLAAEARKKAKKAAEVFKERIETKRLEFETKLEHAERRRKSFHDKLKFENSVHFSKVKSVSSATKAARNQEEKLRKTAIAKSLADAEIKHVAHINSIKAKAERVSKRHAEIVSRVRWNADVSRTELASAIDEKMEAAKQAREHKLEERTNKNSQHFAKVANATSSLSNYEKNLAVYHRARIDSELAQATMTRAINLHAIRLKAALVGERAKATVEFVKNRAMEQTEDARRALENRLARAELVKRLRRSDEMGLGERLSICGSYIIGADNSWRAVPDNVPIISPRKARSLTSSPVQGVDDAETEWEVIGDDTTATAADACYSYAC